MLVCSKAKCLRHETVAKASPNWANIVACGKRETGNRIDEIFVPEDENGRILTFDTFADAEQWFVESDFVETCSARYVNMDEE